MSKVKETRLPYLNNTSVILITMAINLGILLITGWGRSFDLMFILIDGVISGVVTALIDVFLVRHYVDIAQKNRTLPTNLPVNRFMMKLPKNIYLFAALCALFFGLLTPLFNGIVFKYYDFDTLSLAQMLVLKVIYSYYLSAKIVELAIFRLVQPDLTGQLPDQTITTPTKHSAPRVTYFQQLFNNWMTDFGLNMFRGLIIGTTIVTDDNFVLIAPTLLRSVDTTGFISGVIVTFMTVPSVSREIIYSVDSGKTKPLTESNPYVAWLPKNRWLLTVVLCLPIIVLTTIVYYVVMSFFGFESLNFFQFFFIRIAYTTMLVKALVPLIMFRYLQPHAV
ncbi:hypothetical protein DSECCO2_43230 [anaerobic digester metagenome]